MNDIIYVTILDFVTMAVIIIGNVICTSFCSSFEHCNSDVIDFNGISMFLNSRTVRTDSSLKGGSNLSMNKL